MANGNRTNYQAPTILPNTLQQVVTDDGTGNYQRQLANSFLTVAGDAHKRQLAADLDRAKTEGEKIGYDAGKNFRPMKQQSLFARQYNDSGVTTAVTRMTMDAQKTVKQNYEKNKANPNALAASLQKYKDGYTAELPDEMLTPFEMQFDRMADTVVAQAADNLKVLRQQEAAAQFQLYEREMENTVEGFAADAFKGGDAGTLAQLSLRDLRQQYAERLGLDAAGDFAVGGYKFKGSGSGAFTPSEIAEKLLDFDKRVVQAGVLGNFQQEVAAGRGVDDYLSFVNGSKEITTLGEDGKMQSVKIADFLTNDEMEEISTKMRSYMNGIRGLEEAEDKKYQRDLKTYNDNKVRDAYKIAYQTEILPDGSKILLSGDTEQLNALVMQAANDPNVEPETLDKLRTLQEKLGTGGVDDPRTVSQASIDIATGQMNSYQQLPDKGLSDATRVKLMEDIDKRNKGEHWSKSVRYQDASDYADAVLAPEKAAGFNVFGNENSASAADRAEWSKRMIQEVLSAEAAGIMPMNPNAQPGKMPDGRAQFDIRQRGIEIADEIAKRRKAPAADPELQSIDAELKDLDAKIANPSADQDDKAISARYKELQKQKNDLLTKKQMGAY